VTNRLCAAVTRSPPSRLVGNGKVLLPAQDATTAQSKPAVSASKASRPRKPDFTKAPYTDFDFWVGRWEVKTLQGRPAGKNTIRKILGGAAVQEDWVGAGGGPGRSLNMYDFRTRKWHQTWCDSSGTHLRLSGGLIDGNMLLVGEQPGVNGGTVKHEIKWTPRKDGSVRQTWRATRDGKTWRVLADLIYVRAKPGKR